MKILLVGVNAKYIHSSLALWYLKSNSGNWNRDVYVYQCSINDLIDNVIRDIYLYKADVVAFSCYIWNIDYVYKLSESIKQLNIDTKIVLGGPEVSFDAKNILNDKLWIDYIISGEGEVVFEKFLDEISKNKIGTVNLKGVSSRGNFDDNFNIVSNLDEIISPYTTEMFSSTKGRILYYEASRGCPFSCEYCLSSTYKGVRFFSIDRVKRDLQNIINNEISLVKFVDRTFNCHKRRAKEIFEFIISNNIKSVFHFEVAADLFDDELINVLKLAPNGTIQFEIGIQTTNEDVLQCINRKTNTEKVLNNVKKLISLQNIHIHVDLIAGLPKEDLNSFKKSFNEVYTLRSNQLQLGFLKILKGCELRKKAPLYGYKYRQYAPYEILSNNYLSYDELSEIKGIEELVERYYNSERFTLTLEYILNYYFSTPYELYYNFYKFNMENNYLNTSVSSKNLFNILMEFMENVENDIEKLNIINEIIKFDYLSSEKSRSLPEKINRNILPEFKNECFEFLKNKENIGKYVEHYRDEPAKEIYKKVHFEVFDVKISNIIEGNISKIVDKSKIIEEKEIYLFDYLNKDLITGKYNYKKCEF